MPIELSTLLQAFGVDAVLSNALIDTPQMVNIQRSLFNAKQELRQHIEALQATQETELLAMLIDIEKLVDVSKLTEIHASHEALQDATKDIQAAASKAGTTELNGKGTISKNLQRLNGILKFSAASNTKNEDVVKPQAPQHRKRWFW